MSEFPGMKERPILMSAPVVRALLAGTKTQTRRAITDHNSRGNFRASELLLDDPRTFADPGPSPAGNPGHYLHAYVNAPVIEKRRRWKQGDCDPSIMERLYPWVFPGDRLWVRETHVLERCVEPDHLPPFNDGRPIKRRPDDDVDCIQPLWLQPHYKATDPEPELDYEDAGPRMGDGPSCRWKPSIHMPRWASRITLDVASVRVERLQHISEADAMAEGSREWAAEQDTPVRDIPCGETRLVYRQLWESINGPGSWDANPWVWVVEFKRLA